MMEHVKNSRSDAPNRRSKYKAGNTDWKMNM